MNIIIEVGVNTGTDTVGLLNRFPEATYYGFEPTLELHGHLLGKFRDNPRVNFMPVAIDIVEGFKQFNVAGQGDWGCSSLHNFNPNIHELWHNRPDFKVSHTYKVPVMRMDSFLDLYTNPGVIIDYAWIDAQGSDVDVLNSFGYYLDNVKAGRLETAYSVELYSNTTNTLANAEFTLKENGFRYTVTPDDVGKECNIEFWRE